jgi:hypothetical protein
MSQGLPLFLVEKGCEEPLPFFSLFLFTIKKSLKFEENERNLTSFSGHVLLP